MKNIYNKPVVAKKSMIDTNTYRIDISLSEARKTILVLYFQFVTRHKLEMGTGHKFGYATQETPDLGTIGFPESMRHSKE